MSKQGKLTPKQEEQYRRFAKEYIIDFNGTRAAIEAGYSEKTAHAQASRMLTYVKVQEFIKEEIESREERTEITQDKVLQEIANIAFFDIGNIFNGYTLKEIEQLPDETRKAISSIKVREEKGQAGQTIAELTEFRANDKLKAIELLGKHLGMFTDKLELSGQVETKVGMAELYKKMDK